jgi:uncharacterized protein YtpQ (UPF0354 family)
MRPLWIYLILCGLVIPVRADVLTPRAFTNHIRAAVARAMPQAEVRAPRDLEMTIRRPDRSSTFISLANAYQLYIAHPAQLSEIVRVYIAGATQPSAAPINKPDPSRIVPVVKDRAWLAELRRQFTTNDQDAVFDELGADLVIVYAEDTEKRTRYLSSLEKLDVPRQRLRALATENILKVLPKVEMQRHADVFGMITAGDYTTSLLLFDDMWSGKQIKFDGDLVVAIPARDVILITGSRVDKGLQGIRGMARDLANGAYRINANLYVYRNGAFSAFTP